MNSPSVLSRGSAGETQIYDEVLALIDPEPLPRECLAEVLQSEFPRALVVAVADVGEISPEMNIPIAVAMLKVQSPYATGTITQRVKHFEQHLPGTPVIVMGCGSERIAFEAINAGARGVLPVTDPLRIAMAAVRLVLAGGIYYPLRFPLEFTTAGNAVSDGRRQSPAALARSLTLDPGQPVNRAPAPGDQTAHFTARELDVLAALQRGRSNKWIASQLNLSENTVKVHIRHIMRKLKATNRTQAVIYSQSQGPWSASAPDADMLPTRAS
jgi:two-component system, NarL family, nitrate/nitrite response regulator NarL